jgi:hypothetical protein
MSIEKGSPRNANGQASDADAIGIDPVHSGWTVVDGCAGAIDPSLHSG